MPFSTIFKALFYPYITHERTAQNLILSVRSERFALCVKERHRSQNEGSLKSKERLSNFKERCAQLWKLLNRSSLLSEPSFWEQWRSLRKRAKPNERTAKIKFCAVRS